MYTPSFSKNPNSPAFAEDEDVQAYNAAFEQYGSQIASTYTPHCTWGYTEGAVLDQVFQGMEEPTRDSFMESLRSISDFQAPMLLDGITVDTTSSTESGISTVQLVRYDAATGGYGPVDGY